MDAVTKRLRTLARKWDGDIKEVAHNTFYKRTRGEHDPDFYPCPFFYNMGIYWVGKTILFTGVGSWTTAIHEMGHIFASKYPPSSLKTDEFSFIGWEYTLAKYVKGDIDMWHLHMKDYGVGVGDQFEYGQLPLPKRDKWLEGRVAVATKNKLIIDGIPQAIR
jgi:hypothetical protein